MKKRLLASLMCLCLFVGMLPTAAMAADADTATTFEADGIYYRVINGNEVEVYNPNFVESAPTDQEFADYIGDIIIPSQVTYNGQSYSVTAVAGVAFIGAQVSSVTLPDSIVRIGQNAFKGCEATNITLGKGLKEIGSFAFRSCKFESLTIPDGVKTIGDNAFHDCGSLISLTIPGSVTTIGNSAFAGCGNLQTLKLNEGLTSIGTSAFERCHSLTNLTIPASVTNLHKVDNFGMVTTALDLYPNVRNTTFAVDSPFDVQDGILYLENEMVTILSGLGDVTIPDGVTEIPPKFFIDQDTLTSIVIPKGVTKIPSEAFAGCVNLKKVQLPEGVTSIGDYAFDLTKNIGTATNPNYANNNPQLEFINIPSTVTSIGINFLGGVKKDGQTALIFEGNTPPAFAEDAFSGISGDDMNSPTVYYPAEAEDAYTEENNALVTGGLVSKPSEAGKLNNQYALSITEDTASVEVGKTVQLTVTSIVPTGATLSVACADPSIATAEVSEDGKSIIVTSVAEGETTITAKITLDNDSKFVLVEQTAKVTVLAAGKEPAVVLPAAPETKSEVQATDEATQKLVESVTQALAPSSENSGGEKSNGLTVTGKGMDTATSKLQMANEVTSEAGKTALEAENIDTSNKTVTIVIQPYLDVIIKNVEQSTADGTTTTTLVLDITPKYKKVATTADLKNNDNIVLEGKPDKPANAVVLASGDLLVSDTTIVSIPLPASFIPADAAKMFVQHRGYEYEATVLTATEATDVKTIELENPHGFSEFTITATSAAVAKIGDTSYTDLQSALDEAANNDTIILKKSDLSGKLTTTKTVKLKNDTRDQITVTVNGTTYTIAAGDTKEVSYTKPSGGSDHYYEPSYTVSTPANVKNGTVKVSPKSANKGDTVTITVTPDEGYELDEIIVTDKKGDELKVKDKGNGKFTFTMPASKVSISVRFTEIEEEVPTPVTSPSEAFIDLDADAWYREAADFVLSNGMMDGNGAGMFLPYTELNRGMMARVLYNMESKPAFYGSNAFSDVASGTWYTDAVNWAAANKIVSGNGGGMFLPDVAITREGLAVILYNYASYKGYNVDPQGNLSVFTDGAETSPWARNAMEWAVGCGLISGKGGSTLDPKGTATRIEVAQLLMNFCEAFSK